MPKNCGKDTVDNFVLFDFKIYYKATVISDVMVIQKLQCQ